MIDDVEPDNSHLTHEGYECDGCGVFPIIGTRYKCSVCKTSISALAVKNLSLMITPSWSWLIPRMLPLWSLLLLMMIKSQLLLIKKREKILNLMVIANCQDISEKTNTGSNSKEVLISGGAMQWIGPIKSVTAWQDQRLRFKLSINLNMSFKVILMKLWWFQLN